MLSLFRYRICHLGVVVFAMFIGGCSNTYTVNNAHFSDKNAALASQKQIDDSEISEIVPLDYVGGSLLVAVPSDTDLVNPPFVTGNSSADTRDFFLRYYKQDFDAVGEALSKAGIFDTVVTKQLSGYLYYAKQFGYRFVLVNTGQGPFMLYDRATGSQIQLSGPKGLFNLATLVSDGAQKLSAQAPTLTARSVRPRLKESDIKAVDYDEYSHEGEVTSDDGIDGRARAMGLIGQVCASKHVGLQSGKPLPEGAIYTTGDEQLIDGKLSIKFRCEY